MKLKSVLFTLAIAMFMISCGISPTKKEDKKNSSESTLYYK